MKFISDNHRFGLRPFYEKNEIEAICVENLSKYDLLPKEPEPIRIDRFIEKRFGITISYKEVPEGILGYTKFNPDNVEEIVVTTALDEEGTITAERRIRTTLAHEAGHGLLHSQLFYMGDNIELFSSEDFNKERVLCRDMPGITNTYSGEWWEFQANKAIGGLLLPANLVDIAIDRFIERPTRIGLKILPKNKIELAVRNLAEIFNVNPVVVKIRLEDMGIVTDSTQLTL